MKMCTTGMTSGPILKEFYNAAYSKQAAENMNRAKVF